MTLPIGVAQCDRLIPLRDVMAMAGLKKTAIYTRIAAGRFPRPARLDGAVRWSEREVQQWIADRLAARPTARSGAA